MTIYFRFFTAGIIVLCSTLAAMAAPFGKIDAPQLSERWFGIYVNSDRVGFYRQTIAETAEGYRMEGDGSVKMKVMGFSREASSTETYQVAPDLALRSFQAETRTDGSPSAVSGEVTRKGISVVTRSGNGRKTLW